MRRCLIVSSIIAALIVICSCVDQSTDQPANAALRLALSETTSPNEKVNEAGPNSTLPGRELSIVP